MSKDNEIKIKRSDLGTITLLAQNAYEHLEQARRRIAMMECVLEFAEKEYEKAKAGDLPPEVP